MTGPLRRFEFSGPIWVWRGPAPYYFVTVPEAEAAEMEEIARAVTYGWGMIPTAARVGGTAWTTALWPKDGAYIMPIKARVRKAEGLDEGDSVTVELTVGGEPG